MRLIVCFEPFAVKCTVQCTVYYTSLIPSFSDAVLLKNCGQTQLIILPITNEFAIACTQFGTQSGKSDSKVSKLAYNAIIIQIIRPLLRKAEGIG